MMTWDELREHERMVRDAARLAWLQQITEGEYRTIDQIAKSVGMDRSVLVRMASGLGFRFIPPPKKVKPPREPRQPKPKKVRQPSGYDGMTHEQVETYRELRKRGIRAADAREAAMRPRTSIRLRNVPQERMSEGTDGLGAFPQGEYRPEANGPLAGKSEGMPRISSQLEDSM